jgi:DNA-binding NarL/FixJ family response regulator
MHQLVRAIEDDLARRAIQAGLGANQSQQVTSRELADALRKARYLSPSQAREVLRVLGEAGQRALTPSTLRVLIEVA